jgi:hypothetical protein
MSNGTEISLRLAPVLLFTDARSRSSREFVPRTALKDKNDLTVKFTVPFTYDSLLALSSG